MNDLNGTTELTNPVRMEIATAESRVHNFNYNVACMLDAWDRSVFYHDLKGSVKYDCLHCRHVRYCEILFTDSRRRELFSILSQLYLSEW